MTKLRAGRVRLTAAIGGLATFALAACGPTATQATPPGPTGAAATATGASTQSTGGAAGAAGEACALVTTAEAGAVIGASVTAEEQDQGIIKGCRYQPADAVIGTVSVTVLSATLAEFDQAVANLPIASTPVMGIGDKAVFAAAGGELLILSGTHIVGVVVVHKGPTYGTEAEDRTIAQAALSRL